MIKLLRTFAALCLLISTAAHSQIDFKTAKLSAFTANSMTSLDGTASVIVEFKTQSSASSLIALDDKGLIAEMSGARSLFHSGISAKAKASITDTFEYFPGVVMQLSAETLQELQANSQVKGIYENKLNKPFLAESRGIVHKRFASSKVLGTGWAVAVLDTGTDSSHPFFNSGGVKKVVSEACFSGFGIRDSRVERLCPGGLFTSFGAGSGRQCSGYQGCDHGTHVAGIASGSGPDFGGVASDSSLITMQVFTGFRNLTGEDRNLCGGESRCILSSDGDLVRALERVYSLRNTHKIAAVNFSLGGGQFFGSCASDSPALTRSIARLKAAGIATIAASGNNSFTNALSSPACIPDVIAVGATSDYNGTAFGRPFQIDVPTFYSNMHPLVDLFAPGSLITSSVPGGRYAAFNGTSQATPHVAGAFAVLKQAKPDATVNELEALLKSVGPDTTKNGITRKRIDLAKALAELGFGTPIITPLLDILLSE